MNKEPIARIRYDYIPYICEYDVSIPAYFIKADGKSVKKFNRPDALRICIPAFEITHQFTLKKSKIQQLRV